MKKIYYFIFLLFLCRFASAQNHHIDNDTVHLNRCSYTDYINILKSEDPNFENNRLALEKEIDNWIENNQGAIGKDKTVITIPVVVHVIYYTDMPAFNLSESRINEQIQVLNDDYRRLNADASLTPSSFTSVAADCQIEFCLAKRTPDNIFTNGIVRVQTTVSSFTIGSAMKYTSQGGSNAWDRNKYLNIWVCRLTGGILGFAQPPGSNAATDGVVIDYRYFGKQGASSPFNKGRTATHEIGHWLNLYHIWGDDAAGSCNGSDNCTDTPNQADEYYGCPTFPQVSCGTENMFMNYMDYTDDACMNLFTTNQKTRMLAALNGPRASIKASDGCIPGVGIYDTENFSSNLYIYPNPSHENINIELSLPENMDIKIDLINYLGQTVYTKMLYNTSLINQNVDLHNFQNGLYIINISSGNFSTNKKLSVY